MYHSIIYLLCSTLLPCLSLPHPPSTQFSRCCGLCIFICAICTYQWRFPKIGNGNLPNNCSSNSSFVICCMSVIRTTTWGISEWRAFTMASSRYEWATVFEYHLFLYNSVLLENRISIDAKNVLLVLWFVTIYSTVYPDNTLYDVCNAEMCVVSAHLILHICTKWKIDKRHADEYIIFIINRV